MEKEKNFKWMVYTLLFLILYYISKEGIYLLFSGISAIGLSVTIIEVISKYIKRKGKLALEAMLHFFLKIT